MNPSHDRNRFGSVLKGLEWDIDVHVEAFLLVILDVCKRFAERIQGTIGEILWTDWPKLKGIILEGRDEMSLWIRVIACSRVDLLFLPLFGGIANISPWLRFHSGAPAVRDNGVRDIAENGNLSFLFNGSTKDTVVWDVDLDGVGGHRKV